MGKITRHSKERIVQRTEGCESFAEAKKLAKQAKRSGATINQFQKFQFRLQERQGSFPQDLRQAER